MGLSVSRMDDHLRNKNRVEKGTNYMQTTKEKSANKSLIQDVIVKHCSFFKKNMDFNFIC